jgi:hypothetical protein
MEALVGSVLGYYADKYLENLKPGDLRLSLWGAARLWVWVCVGARGRNADAARAGGGGDQQQGGDLVLRNLTLKLQGAGRPTPPPAVPGLVGRAGLVLTHWPRTQSWRRACRRRCVC